MSPKSAIFESHPTGISGVFRCGPGPKQARFETLRMEVAKVWVGFPRSRATEVPEKLQSGKDVLRANNRTHAGVEGKRPGLVQDRAALDGAAPSVDGC